MWTVFKRGEEAGWINKGFDLIKHGKPAEAIECFTKALELNPKDSEGWLGKGIALAHLDQHRALHPPGGQGVARCDVHRERLVPHIQQLRTAFAPVDLLRR